MTVLLSLWRTLDDRLRSPSPEIFAHVLIFALDERLDLLVERNEAQGALLAVGE